MTKDEALNQARSCILASLEYKQGKATAVEAVEDIDKVLAQPEQETVQRLSALVRAQQITIDKLEAQLEQEPVSWEGGEGWESLAWELCADENGEDSCNELIWEGGPIPEPWGDRWMKYEEEAKRLIALVQKHTTPPQRKPLTDEQRKAIEEKQKFPPMCDSYVYWFFKGIDAAEAAHNIKENT